MIEIDTLRDLLVAGRGGDPSIVTPDGSVLDYDQVRDEVTRLGDKLRALGVGPGDRIAIVLPNGPEMAIVFLAAATTGCAAPLNPKYRMEEFRFYLDDLDARVLITRAGDPEAARVAASDTTVQVTLNGSAGNLELIADRSVVGRREEVPDRDDVALVLHTSGTTSRPKIVPIRQRNLARSASNIAASLGLTSTDRSLNVMPLFHIHGLLAGLLAPLSAGGSVACTEGFDPFRFFSVLKALKPTYYTAVPTMHQMVIARSASRREAARSSGLRFVRSSSASLPVPVLEELRALFGVPVIEAYGMTEATHQMASNPLPPGTTKEGSVGNPTGIELAILDDQDQSLPVGERGEVSIKGATVVDAYENNPAANEAAFTSGWFRTGDEGYLDGDGYLFLTGRLKEQINRGGEKISPLEVDEALLRHDKVAQAVTFAVPHDKLGEDVAAAVVLVEGATVGERELRDFVSESLAAFKVPTQVFFLEELPRGPTGKLQRIGLGVRLGLGG
jgi:acyl-CoA synthetase (AMP-forming)/AMP-acid ligase II